MGGLSLWHWLIVLVIVVIVFGTKRLKNVGQDLGEAVKGFKKGMHGDGEAKPPEQLPDTLADQNLREDEVVMKPRDDDRNPPVAR